MALIPKVGRRSPGTRATIILMYALLIAGAVTMVVPFLITINQSVATTYDFEQYNLFPKYVFDDDQLFMCFLFDKYGGNFDRTRFFLKLAEVSTVRQLTLARNPVQDFFPIAARYHRDKRNIAAIRADYEAVLSNVAAEELADTFPLEVNQLYPAWYRERYTRLAREAGWITDDTADPDQAALAYMQHVYGEVLGDSFDNMYYPAGTPRGPRIYWRGGRVIDDFRLYWKSLPIRVKIPIFQDKMYGEWLAPRHTTIEALNEAWGTRYRGFVEIPFTDEPPAQANARADWTHYVEKEFPLRRTVIRADLSEQFRDYARQRGSLDALNARLGTAYTSWQELPFTRTYTGSRGYRHLWSDFVLDTVPADLRELHFFEKDLCEYLRAKYATVKNLSAAYGMPVDSFESYRVPFDLLDYDQFWQDRDRWRKRFLTRNYQLVLSYILLHGRALLNTVVLVVLTILAGVTVNPLAAYALSRYNLRNTQKILIFLLIPMAFPAEVSMIPSFLLLKAFPLAPMICGIAAGLAVFLGLQGIGRYITAGRGKLGSGNLAMLTALVAGYLCGPRLAGLLGLAQDISLLNTYPALVLPSLANGFSIFLLKGFFDGLPRELYEAAQLDGAGELRMFRIITYPLCKPIIALAVVGNVLAAYGGFLWAFVVCQDERMWTLMVWLYKFTTQYSGHNMPLVMASLVIASMPTLVIFVFCQRIIMRGIILPTMH